MHVADLDLGILGANGIVGGGIPIAAGAALAAQLQGTDQVAVSFIGDGATDIGVFHESLNLAALWDLPVVFVVENNGYADFIAQRDHQRIEQVSEAGRGLRDARRDRRRQRRRGGPRAASEAVDRARGGRGPTLLECVTYRWRGHFEGDPQPYRSQDEVEAWKERDPLALAERRLADRGELDEAERDTIRDAVRARVAEAVEFAEAAPMPEPLSALEDVFTDGAEEGW